MTDIRRARHDELDLLMAFIDQHWKKGHALAVSKALLIWQHGAPDGSLDFLIAVRDREVIGVLGYIATRRFDPALKDNNVLWLALWKVREDCGNAGLGLRMLGVLSQIEPHCAMAVNGINPAHPPLYRALHYSVGQLQQYFMVNADVSRQLIQISGVAALPVVASGASEFILMTEQTLSALPQPATAAGVIPLKTPLYFLNRYLRHPIYHYRVFLASGAAHRPALFAVRIARHNNACALRIVDFCGDPLAIAGCGSALKKLMDEANAEYTDFWQMGIEDQHLTASGFARVDPDGAVVVPNYFEPFVAANGRIQCAIRSDTPQCAIFCRADGDQDRPNQIGEAT